MFKLKKLNARGFAHHFLLAIVIVGVAVGGTYYLVASHADTCTGTSDPVSGIQSGPASDPTSGPTSSPDCTPASSPVTAPATGTVSCVINGVPHTPAYGAVLKPTVVITNIGSQTITGAIAQEGFSLSSAQGQSKGGSSPIALPDIAPGASYTGKLSTYAVAYASNTTNRGTYEVSSTSPVFDCSAPFSLPQVPVIAATCTIEGVPTTVKKGNSFSPQVSVKNTGNTAFTLNMTSNVNPNKGSTVDFKNFSVANFKPGTTIKHTLGKYTVPKSSNATSGVVTAHDPDAKLNFSCKKSFKV